MFIHLHHLAGQRTALSPGGILWNSENPRAPREQLSTAPCAAALWREPQPAGGSALLTKWLAKQPANKARRSHHRRRRLQPPAQALPGAYPLATASEELNLGSLLSAERSPAQGSLGNVVPATSRGRRLRPRGPPRRDYSTRAGCSQRCSPSVEKGPSPEGDSGCSPGSEGGRELHFPVRPARSRSRQPRFA